MESIATTLEGSPPLTRGKALFQGFRQFTDRITPAYAGKRRFRFEPRRNGRDHPRLRGEKLVQLHGQTGMKGSPPLTRGKGSSTLCRCRLQRITPAYAGKSTSSSLSVIFVEDHPRLRGEKRAAQGTAEDSRGSPPLTRGKALLALRKLCFWRITPAYAGKSVTGMPGNAGSKDHPRLRGEKIKHQLRVLPD